VMKIKLLEVDFMSLYLCASRVLNTLILYVVILSLQHSRTIVKCVRVSVIKYVYSAYIFWLLCFRIK
jgi:hypothetical protein